MASSYAGFQKKRATNLMPEYTAALGQLEAAGAFQYDVTQPVPFSAWLRLSALIYMEVCMGGCMREHI